MCIKSLYLSIFFCFLVSASYIDKENVGKIMVDSERDYPILIYVHNQIVISTENMLVFEKIKQIYKEEKIELGLIRMEEGEENLSIPELFYLLSKEEFNNFLFMNNKKKDRSCLLSQLKYTNKDLEMVKLEEGLGVEGKLTNLINFLNKKLNTFRTIEGQLTEYGKYRKNLLVKLEENIELRECESISIEELDESIFLREYVFKSKPVIIKGAIKDWPALQKWNRDEYFEKIKHFGVKVAPFIDKNSNSNQNEKETGIFEGCEPIEKWNPDLTEKIPQKVLESLESLDRVVVRPAHLNLKDFNTFLEHLDKPNKKSSFYLEYSSINQFPHLLNDITHFNFSSFLVLDTKNIWYFFDFFFFF